MEEIEHKDRTKDGPTRKRGEAEQPPRQTFKEWADTWKSVLRKVTIPTKDQWLSTLWRVALILLVFGIILFVVDYLLLEGVLKLQVAMTPFGIRWLEVVYTAFIVVFGFVSVASILASTGGTEGGLSSMLGSSVQYSDTTGEVGRTITKTTFISSGVMFLLCLFAPLFLGGI